MVSVPPAFARPAPPPRSPFDASTVAKAGLIVSVLGVLASWTGGPGVVLAVVGLLISLYALWRDRTALDARKLALWGLALGLIGILLGLLLQRHLWHGQTGLQEQEDTLTINEQVVNT